MDEIDPGEDCYERGNVTDSAIEYVTHISDDSWSSGSNQFVNTFKKSRYTDLILIANDSNYLSNEIEDGGVFHCNLYVLTQVSNHWQRHFEDIDPLNTSEYILNLDYSAYAITTWLNTFHLVFGSNHACGKNTLKTLMPMYLKYGMDAHLNACYKFIEGAKTHSPEVIKLIFTIKPFYHLIPHVVKHILIEETHDITADMLTFIPLDYITDALNQKNKDLGMTRNNRGF